LKENEMGDAVDGVIEAWSAERPDLDFWPVGVIGRIQRLARLLDRAIQDLCAAHGLEQSEADLLMTLRRAGAPYQLSATALLKAALVTSGAITNRVDRLEHKGLVERVRSSQDRRSVEVRLTDHGRATVDTLIAAHITNEARLLQTLPRRRADALAGLLRQLLQSLEPTDTASR
jgi:DNA-binding MarR family transcriptional regulator